MTEAATETRTRAKAEDATKANIVRLTNAALAAVAQLGEQGNRGHHTKEEAEKVFAAIDKAVEAAAEKFANPSKKAATPGFSL